MARSFLLLRTAHNIICLVGLLGVMALQPYVLAQESPKPATPDPLAISREDKLKVFEKLWEIVNKEYYDPQFNEVDWAKVKETYRPQVEAAKNKLQLHGVLQKMLDELHSSHLTVSLDARLTNERVKQDIGRDAVRKERFNFDLGIKLASVEGRHAVDTVAEGSGAQVAGVQRGWILTHLNGEPYRNPENMIRDLGEKVSLRLIDSQGQERTLEVICKLYPVPLKPPERISRLLDGGSLYLRFAEFTAGTDGWLANEVTRNRQAPAIILDLRGNPGGLDSVLRKCFEPFFSDPTVFGEFRERHGKEPQLKVSGRSKSAYTGRVFVLIDEMTESAAEMFAAGLQESGRSIVIGRQSSAHVLSSYKHNLSSGLSALIAARNYQTAKGIRLEGHGVIPDEPVKLTMKDFLEKHDPDLERVHELLQKTASPAKPMDNTQKRKEVSRLGSCLLNESEGPGYFQQCLTPNPAERAQRMLRLFSTSQGAPADRGR